VAPVRGDGRGAATPPSGKFSIPAAINSTPLPLPSKEQLQRKKQSHYYHHYHSEWKCQVKLLKRFDERSYLRNGAIFKSKVPERFEY